MRVLVVGANGLLGSNLASTETCEDIDFFGTYHSEKPELDVPLRRLDVTDTDRFRDIIQEFDPDWVVNCAAMTDVDACETNPTGAYDVNARAPGKMAELCAARSVRFLHVSTDYVFDGRQRVPYRENAEQNPIQVYGASKLAGEREVTTAAADPVVVRLSFVYGIHRSTGELRGFPAWVRDRLNSGSDTPLFTDQFVTPTRAGQAAARLAELVSRGDSGTYHVASTSCLTPYEFGRAVAQRMGKSESLLREGSLNDVERDATRPAYTCLDVSRLEESLGVEQPSIDDDLAALSDVFEG